MISVYYLNQYHTEIMTLFSLGFQMTSWFNVGNHNYWLKKLSFIYENSLFIERKNHYLWKNMSKLWKNENFFRNANSLFLMRFYKLTQFNMIIEQNCYVFGNFRMLLTICWMLLSFTEVLYNAIEEMAHKKNVSTCRARRMSPLYFQRVTFPKKKLNYNWNS